MPTKIRLVKAMVFPVVMYGCANSTIKKAERRRNGAFELWCWGRLLRVPWPARRSNQSVLKKVNPEYSLEGLMNSNPLATWCQKLTHWKRPWCWEKMVKWHYWLDEHEFEKTPGVSDGQGGLACCSPWGREESGKECAQGKKKDVLACSTCSRFSDLKNNCWTNQLGKSPPNPVALTT